MNGFKPFPRATSDIVTLEGAVWNRLCDSVESLLAMSFGGGLAVQTIGSVKAISSAGDGSPFLTGIIIDGGPDGEADFEDNRYWVKVEEVDNTDSDPTSKTVIHTDGKSAGATTVVRGRYVVVVTNLAESRLKGVTTEYTHLLSPGDPIWFWRAVDKSPIVKYITFLTPTLPPIKFAKLTDTWAYGVNHLGATDSDDVTKTYVLNCYLPQNTTDSPQYFPAALGDEVGFIPYGKPKSTDGGIPADGLIIGWRPIPKFTKRFQGLFAFGSAGVVNGLWANYVQAHGAD